MTISIAVIGAGSWSATMHLPVFKRLSREGAARYCAVCDLEIEKARKYAAQLDAKAFTGLDDMIRGEKPDGLAIIAGPKALPGLIKKAVERGIPFITEKPPAPSEDVHRQLIEAVGELPHIVAYNRRHAPYISEVVKWMRGENIILVTARFIRHRRFDDDFTSTAVHAIDTVRYLVGGDLRDLNLSVTRPGGVANYFIHGSGKTGTRISMDIIPNSAAAMEHYWIHSTDRMAFISFPQPPVLDAPGKIQFFENNELVKEMTAADFSMMPDDMPGLGGILGEHKLFIDVLKGGSKPVSTLQTSLQTQQIRDTLKEMAANSITGKSVTFS